jgi:preprotein translocase subunit Sec61beta
MDRHEQHQQRKAKEREEKKKAEKTYEEESEQGRPPLHPAWFVAIGVALVGVVVYVWTFLW